MPADSDGPKDVDVEDKTDRVSAGNGKACARGQRNGLCRVRPANGSSQCGLGLGSLKGRACSRLGWVDGRKSHCSGYQFRL